MPLLFILLWSSGYIFVESGLQDNSPLVFLSMRLLLAWFVVATILVIQRPRFSLSSDNIFWMLLTGILIQGFYQVFLFAAISEGLSPGILTIILGMQPIFTIIILRETLMNTQLMGLFLGLAGLTLTVSDSLFTGNHSSISIFFAFLSLFGITVGTILQKKYCGRHSLTTTLFWQYMASTLFALILYILLDDQTIHWTNQFVISLSWMVFVVSLSATYLYYALLTRNKAVTVTSYLYCIPPVTTILDYILYNHAISNTTMIGMILVVFSLVLTSKRKFLNNRRIMLRQTK